MDEETKARFKAMGINVRSLTQEEADSLGVLMFTGLSSGKSKPGTPKKPATSTPPASNLPDEQEPANHNVPEEER